MVLTLFIFTNSAWAGEAGLFYVPLPPAGSKEFLQLSKLFAILDEPSIRQGYFIIKWRVTDDGMMSCNLNNYKPVRVSGAYNQNTELKFFSGFFPGTREQYSFRNSETEDEGWVFELRIPSPNQSGNNVTQPQIKTTTKKGALWYGHGPDANNKTLEELEPKLRDEINKNFPTPSTGVPINPIPSTGVPINPIPSTGIPIKSKPAIMSGSCTSNNGNLIVSNMKFYPDHSVRITNDPKGRLDYQDDQHKQELITKGLREGTAILDASGNIVGANHFTSLATDEGKIAKIWLHQGTRLPDGTFSSVKGTKTGVETWEETWSYITEYMNPKTTPTQVSTLRCTITRHVIKQPDASGAEKKG